MAGDVAVEEVFDGFAVLGKVRAFGDDADGGNVLIDWDEPDPGARQIEDVNVDIVGGFRSAAIDAFEPVVNGELIEERVVAFEAKLGAEDGAAAGGIDDEFAAKEICRGSRGNEA